MVISTSGGLTWVGATPAGVETSTRLRRCAASMPVRSTITRMSLLCRLRRILGSPRTVTSTSLGLTLEVRTSSAVNTTMTGSLGKVRSLVARVREPTGEPSFWLARLMMTQTSTARASEMTLGKESGRRVGGGGRSFGGAGGGGGGGRSWGQRGALRGLYLGGTGA